MISQFFICTSKTKIIQIFIKKSFVFKQVKNFLTIYAELFTAYTKHKIVIYI